MNIHSEYIYIYIYLRRDMQTGCADNIGGKIRRAFREAEALLKKITLNEIKETPAALGDL